MCDTNWCTFCDCAVSPFSNSIYCSEDCFRKDALLHDPLYKIYKEQQEQQHHFNPKFIINKSDIPDNNMPEYTHQQTRRESNSSMCSEDLAAIHMDMIPCSPPSKTAPQLSTSMSLASSHNDTILRTPPLSYSDAPIYERIPESDMPFHNTAPQVKL